MSDTVHTGHRKRVRQKILSGGISGFPDHEILEFLLFYTILRRNTNVIAHKIIDRFGSLSGVSQASVDDICSLGISRKSAALIKHLPQLASFIFTDDLNGDDRPSLTSSAAATEYFRQEFADVDSTIVKLCCLTRSLHLINTATVLKGGINSSPESMMKMIRFLIENRCRDVIIASNHADDSLLPSKQELEAIRKISDLFSSLDIRLVDYVIVSKDGIPISLRDAGYLSDLKLSIV